MLHIMINPMNTVLWKKLGCLIRLYEFMRMQGIQIHLQKGFDAILNDVSHFFSKGKSVVECLVSNFRVPKFFPVIFFPKVSCLCQPEKLRKKTWKISPDPLKYNAKHWATISLKDTKRKKSNKVKMTKRLLSWQEVILIILWFRV